jgi:hypothetical protein
MNLLDWDRKYVGIHQFSLSVNEFLLSLNSTDYFIFRNLKVVF